MKKFLIAAAMSLALFAGPAMASDTVSGQVEFDSGYTSTIDWTHVFDGGFAAGLTEANDFGNTKFNALPSKVSSTRFEAHGGLQETVSVFTGYAQVGLGANFREDHNFGYYQGTVGLDTALTPNWTWNTVKFRYRDGFDSSDLFKTERVYSGVTYSGVPGWGLSAGAFDDLPTTINYTTIAKSAVGFYVGASHNF